MMYPLGHTASSIDWRLGGGADWEIDFGFGCGAFSTEARAKGCTSICTLRENSGITIERS